MPLLSRQSRRLNQSRPTYGTSRMVSSPSRRGPSAWMRKLSAAINNLSNKSRPSGTSSAPVRTDNNYARVRIPPQGNQSTVRRQPVSPTNHQSVPTLSPAEALKRRRIFFSCVVGLLLIAVFYFGKLWIDVYPGGDGFYSGISVDMTDLKGLTYEEAKQQLQAANVNRMSGLTTTLAFGEQTWQITAADIDAELNIDEVLTEAWKTGHTGGVFQRQSEINALKSNPVIKYTTIKYNEDKLNAILADIKSKIDISATDATINFNTTPFTYTDDTTGREVNFAALQSKVLAQFDSGTGGTIEIQPAVVEPRITRSLLEKNSKQVSRAATKLDGSTQNRIDNIKLALSAFDGLLIAPGERVSFNDVVGERTEARGYKSAMEIVDGALQEGTGGGICQVSTTLYNAVVKAGLKVLERAPHSQIVKYVDPGKDAMVNYGTQDLVFENTTEYAVFIRSNVSDNLIEIFVYGQPLGDGVTIEVVPEVIKEIDPPNQRVVEDTGGLYVKYTDESRTVITPKKGYDVETYAVYKRDGTEFDRVKLNSSHYNPVQGEVYIGVSRKSDSTSSGSGNSGNTSGSGSSGNSNGSGSSNTNTSGGSGSSGGQSAPEPTVNPTPVPSSTLPPDPVTPEEPIPEREDGTTTTVGED